MFSIQRARDLLGEARDLSDAEVQELLDAAYALAHLFVDYFLEQPQTFNPAKFSETNNFKAALRLVPNADEAAIEERAAILEFDGALPRDEAERAAIMLIATKKEKQ